MSLSEPSRDQSGLADMLARVEKALDYEQWSVIRDAARVLFRGADPQLRVNQLCDVGAFTDAALVMVERALPRSDVSLFKLRTSRPQARVITDYSEADDEIYQWEDADAATPALALIAALLKALQAPASQAEPAYGSTLHSTSSQTEEG